MPGPHGVSQARAYQPSGRYPESQQGQVEVRAIFGTKWDAGARSWYAAVRNRHTAPLEPIEGDEHSDLSPLTREMPQVASVRGEHRSLQAVMVVGSKESDV
jgi:hypothetical protein